MNALLTRLWQRTQRPGCIQHAAGPEIVARHMRNAAAPPLASLLLRRTHTTDYTAPDPPVIVTASPADPAPTLPRERRFPTVRARPSQRANPASPVASARAFASFVTQPTDANGSGARDAGGATGIRVVNDAEGIRGTNSAGRPDGAGIGAGVRVVEGVRATDGAGTRSVAGTDSGTGARGSIRTRSSTGTGSRVRAVDGVGPSAGAVSSLGAVNGAGVVESVRAVDGAGTVSGAQAVGARPAQRPVVVPRGGRTGPPSGQPPPHPSHEGTAIVRAAVAPGRDRPVVEVRQTTLTERTVVRAHEAGSRDQGVATRALPGGTMPTVSTAPAVPREAAPRVTNKQDDPGRPDREKVKPPRIDIDGIVTTVQRRLVHQMAIERERRGMPR